MSHLSYEHLAIHATLASDHNVLGLFSLDRYLRSDLQFAPITEDPELLPLGDDQTERAHGQHISYHQWHVLDREVNVWSYSVPYVGQGGAHQLYCAVISVGQFPEDSSEAHKLFLVWHTHASVEDVLETRRKMLTHRINWTPAQGGQEGYCSWVAK